MLNSFILSSSIIHARTHIRTRTHARTHARTHGHAHTRTHARTHAHGLTRRGSRARIRSFLYCYFAHLCRSYPCPGSIAMAASPNASRLCASVGSWLLAFCSLRFALGYWLLAPHSVHPTQSGPPSRFIPSHLHCCYPLCNIRVVSSHYMAISRKAVLVDSPGLFISDSIFPCFALNPSLHFHLGSVHRLLFCSI